MAVGFLSRAARFLSRAARFLASIPPVPAVLDPGAWLIRHRHADLHVPAAFFALGTIGLLALNAASAPNIGIGLPPLAFMLFVAIRAYRANAARRREVAAELDGARYMARQCMVYLDLLETSVSDSTGNNQARLAMARLSSGIGLLITRYRRYLDERAVDAAMDAERLVLAAEINQDGGIEDVRAVSHHLGILGGGILDIDDPRVSYGLGRI
ncbi:MAG: hypothetical protein OXU37_07945 [Thaumarchaeota archaeon]|nr:hypothetical protein [Nitrososphaerota archaeon]